MRERERHRKPWRHKYGTLFDLFHRIECRLAKLFSQHEGEPAYHDSWGCPYWLYVEDGHWNIFSYRRKVGDVGASERGEGQLEIGDIEIHDPRDRGLGLGSFLLAQVISFARESSITQIVGRVTKEDLAANPKLLVWYQDFGFQARRTTRPDDMDAAHIWMDLPG